MIYLFLVFLLMTLVFGHMSIMTKYKADELKRLSEETKKNDLLSKNADILNKHTRYIIKETCATGDLKDSIANAISNYAVKMLISSYVKWAPPGKFNPILFGMPLRVLTEEEKLQREQHFLNNFPACLDEVLGELVKRGWVIKIQKKIRKK